MIYLIIYLVAANIVAFSATTIDKKLAVKHCRRISERTLILLAAIGGSAGELAAMYSMHHKTRKPKFRYGVPAILLLQLAAALLFYFYKTGNEIL